MQIAGNLVDVDINKIYPAEITIKAGKISSITKVKKKFKNYILPGLVDAHIHIESSLLCPSRFAQVVVPHGTIATVSDPHEIANVMGMAGINYMIADAKSVPLKVFYTAPSCVPATDFETTGAKLTAKQISQLLKKKEIVALGEMMNFPGVIFNDKQVLAKIKVAKIAKKPVDGHAPGLLGQDLKKYIRAGISTDHECFTFKEAAAKAKLGMKIMLRQGSSAKNLKDLINIAKQKPDSAFFVSDDLHPDDLIKGHTNLLLKQAVKLGVNPIMAVKMASLNPVKHYRLPVGLGRVGDYADLIEVSNLKDFKVLRVFINGKLVAQNGKTLFKVKPKQVASTFKIKKKSVDDFIVKADKDTLVRVIKVIPNQIVTGQRQACLKVKNGDLQPEVKKDILKIAVCERYGHNRIGLGFIQGFGLKRGAIATSVAHDSHNIVTVGTSNEAMARAVNEIIKMKGGLVAYNGKKVVNHVRKTFSNVVKLELPIAGLMSSQKVEIVNKKLEDLHRQVKKMGCRLHSPFMTLSFMALLVIPELKLSDQGLFDGKNFAFTPHHIDNPY